MASAQKEGKDINALRQKAMLYYKANGIPVKIEEVLNSMFHDDPPDPYGHLANFFGALAKQATLNELSATMVLDGQGLPTIKTKVFCTVWNKSKVTKLISSSIIPRNNFRKPMDDRLKAYADSRVSVIAAVDMINTEISSKIQGMSAENQADIDQLLLTIIEFKKKVEEEKKKEIEASANELTIPAETKETISSQSANTPAVAKKKPVRMSAPARKSIQGPPAVPDKPLEQFLVGSEAVAAVSQAVCTAAAITNNLPLYQYIKNLVKGKAEKSELRIPLPMVTIIQGGRSVVGRLNCIKEFMIVPANNIRLDENIEHINNIYNYVEKVLYNKYGVSMNCVSANGALCPHFDTPNQGLDLLQEAIVAQGLTVGKDVFLALNIAAHEFYDQEKGKYEVVEGTFKQPDEMAGFWHDVLLKYPSVIALIDPIRGEDADAWVKLCDKMSASLYIMGNHFYNRPGLLCEEDLKFVWTTGIVLHMERLNTITDIVKCAEIFEDLDNEIVISTNDHETVDTFIVDLAAGLNAKFIKIGGPSLGERSCKLNRLLEIYHELELPEEPEPTDLANVHEEVQITEEVVTSEEVEVVPDEGDAGDTEALAENISADQSAAEAVTKLRLKLHEGFVFTRIVNPPLPDDQATVIISTASAIQLDIGNKPGT
ncbi:unnamed protein product [Lymnaea stagnalis]|uniref:Enolase 4 n=1 Tax=Lymnaea stagnalis TaxID=6523 RepID=A0AAV2HC32_LYMST